MVFIPLNHQHNIPNAYICAHETKRVSHWMHYHHELVVDESLLSSWPPIHKHTVDNTLAACASLSMENLEVVMLGLLLPDPKHRIPG